MRCPCYASCRVVITLIALPLIAVQFGCATDYAAEVRKSLEQSYGRDLKDYTFRATPVGSYGVGTIYLKDVKGNANPDNSWLIGSANSWFAANVSAADRAKAMSQMVEEGKLGDASLTKAISTNLSLSAVLPNVYQVLNLEPGLDVNKGVQVTLTAANAINRRINWIKLQEAINGGLINDATKKHLVDRDIVMGAADIVLGGYTAKVTVDDKVNAKLKASLDQAVGKVLGKDAGLDVSVGRTENGTYEIVAKDPVIAAVLYLEPPPQAGTRGQLATKFSDLYDWNKVQLNAARLKSIEEAKAKQ